MTDKRIEGQPFWDDPAYQMMRDYLNIPWSRMKDTLYDSSSLQIKECRTVAGSPDDFVQNFRMQTKVHNEQAMLNLMEKGLAEGWLMFDKAREMF